MSRRPAQSRQKDTSLNAAEPLDEEQQDQILEKFEKQDKIYNQMYTGILSVLSVFLCMFYGWLAFKSENTSLPLLLAFISTAGAPFFVWFGTSERALTRPYQIVFAFWFIFSCLPMVMSDQMNPEWALPIVAMILNAIVVHDMTTSKLGIKNLKQQKYDLKGA